MYVIYVIYIYINIVTDFIVAHASHASRVIILLYTCDGSMDVARTQKSALRHIVFSPRNYAANIIISHAYVLVHSVCVHIVTLLLQWPSLLAYFKLIINMRYNHTMIHYHSISTS